MAQREEINDLIATYGNRGGTYMPFNNAVGYPLRSMDFVRTGFLRICPTLSARDYKDPKIVVRMKRV